MKVSNIKVTTNTAKVDKEIHHASMLFLPCANSSPKLGVPGGTPKPKKSKEVSDKMAILSLTSLDFLGLGVPPGTPSLGELLAQGKNNIDAWWISLSTFAVLVVTLMLLTFMGDALRDALDPRKARS